MDEIKELQRRLDEAHHSSANLRDTIDELIKQRDSLIAAGDKMEEDFHDTLGQRDALRRILGRVEFVSYQPPEVRRAIERIA